MDELHMGAFDRMVWWWQKPGDTSVSSPEKQREIDELNARYLVLGHDAVVDGKVRVICDGHFLGATPKHCIIRNSAGDRFTVKTQLVDRIEFIPGAHAGDTSLKGQEAGHGSPDG